MFFTGKGISVYRLTVAKAAIKMEAKGMKMSRGVSWTRVMRSELGLKPRTPHAQVIEAIDRVLADLDKVGRRMEVLQKLNTPRKVARAGGEAQVQREMRNLLHRWNSLVTALNLYNGTSQKVPLEVGV